MSDPKEPTPHAEDTNDIEGHDPDEGSGESDVETDVDGDEGDDTEHAEDAAETTSGAEEEVAQPAQPARRSASDVIRAEKKARKDFEARAATAQAERDQARQRAEAAERRAEAAERAAQERRAEQTREAEAARLETMTLMADVVLPQQAIREQVARGISLIIHQARAQDGSRRVTGIAGVAGISEGRIVLRHLMRDGVLLPGGAEKPLLDLLASRGHPVASLREEW